MRALIVLLSTFLFLSGCASTRGITRVDADLYRSPQPTREQLEKYVPQYGIQAVISLRDRTPEYEVQFCQDRGVSYFSVPLNKESSLDHLLDVFRVAKKPMLVHCLWGKDRTGLAVETWLDSKDRLKP